ncbi:hypothetical protein CR513_26330, partial [Mucuna pruriens]
GLIFSHGKFPIDSRSFVSSAPSSCYGNRKSSFHQITSPSSSMRYGRRFIIFSTKICVRKFGIFKLNSVPFRNLIDLFLLNTYIESKQYLIHSWLLAIFRIDPPTIEDVESLLLQEVQFDKFCKELLSATITASIAQISTVQPNSTAITSSEEQDNNASLSHGRGRGRGRGGGSGRSSGCGFKPTYELCNKYGHNAFHCPSSMFAPYQNTWQHNQYNQNA